MMRSDDEIHADLHGLGKAREFTMVADEYARRLAGDVEPLMAARDEALAKVAEFRTEYAVRCDRGRDVLPVYKHMGENRLRAERYVRDDVTGWESVVQRLVGPWQPLAAGSSEVSS